MTPTSDLIVGLYEPIFLSIRTKLQEPDQAGRQIEVNVPGVGGVFRFVPPKTAISSATRGFTSLRPSAYTAPADEPPLDFRISPPDKSNMSRYLFGGFSRCLYPIQKFRSDAERKLAVILEREALKWFKPARGQFQLYYRSGIDDQEYQPDFVAETETRILMMEPKASNQMQDPEVLAKRDVAVEWCRHATQHAASYGGKPWTYLLVPHDAIAENMTIEGLSQLYTTD
jgi:type III restriction enzyme